MACHLYVDKHFYETPRELTVAPVELLVTPARGNPLFDLRINILFFY